jgi:hypothetical protein
MVQVLIESCAIAITSHFPTAIISHPEVRYGTNPLRERAFKAVPYYDKAKRIITYVNARNQKGLANRFANRATSAQAHLRLITDFEIQIWRAQIGPISVTSIL